MTAQAVLPRWRGFNLLELFSRQGPANRRNGNFREDDFRWIAGWGFDFVRIPMDYPLWVEGDDIYRVKEATLEQIDRVVRLGERYGLHVSLNFHAAPGYCINPKPEPFNLWQDEEALRAFCFHWGLFAERCRGIPAARLSFDLVNEPRVPSELGTHADHERVVRAATATIRERDPGRPIIADGLEVGKVPANRRSQRARRASSEPRRPATGGDCRQSNGLNFREATEPRRGNRGTSNTEQRLAAERGCSGPGARRTVRAGERMAAGERAGHRAAGPARGRAHPGPVRGAERA